MRSWCRARLFSRGTCRVVVQLHMAQVGAVREAQHQPGAKTILQVCVCVCVWGDGAVNMQHHTASNLNNAP
jgi:hypothetical protein